MDESRNHGHHLAPLKERADVLVARLHPAYSRAALSKLFDQGLVRANAKQLKPGDRILVDTALEVDISPLQKPIATIELPVLFENDDVIVVNKPVGVISHARGKYWDEPSVASFVREKISGMEGERAGIVHRLDRATSGVMVCAKNQAALSWLQRQFSDRKVRKTYLAIVSGTPKTSEAVIDMPIERNPKAPATFRVGANGKPAKTHYTVLATTETHSLLKLEPETGRTHQLRVHLRQIGHPIVGDTLYGGEAAERLMLHAFRLTVVLPGRSEITFEAPEPAVFQELVPHA